MFSAKLHGYIDLDMEQIQEGQGQKKTYLSLCLLLSFYLTTCTIKYMSHSFVFIGVRVYTFVGKQIFAVCLWI